VSGRLLTARVVADQLGVSIETVLRWARRGDIPSVQLSTRAIRFREDELEAWLQGRNRATPARGDVSPPPAGRRPAASLVGVTTSPKHKENLDAR
jgi:excisionase family DNA binding protein